METNCALWQSLDTSIQDMPPWISTRNMWMWIVDVDIDLDGEIHIHSNLVSLKLLGFVLLLCCSNMGLQTD